MTQTVGKVYAEALFALAQEEQCEERIYREINETADLLAQYPELLELLSVPTLSVEERLEVLHKIIGEEDGIMENFLSLLVERHRISRMADIRTAYNALYYEQFSIAEVFVTTAAPLTEMQRSTLCENMQKKLGKEIKLTETIDPGILGGMIVQYGDTRMDNSLKSRMREMSDQLKQI